MYSEISQLHYLYYIPCEVPEFAKVPTYICCEKNQRIYLWFHAEGAEPYWEVPDIEEISSGQLQCVGFTQAEMDGHTEVRLLLITFHLS